MWHQDDDDDDDDDDDIVDDRNRFICPTFYLYLSRMAAARFI